MNFLTSYQVDSSRHNPMAAAIKTKAHRGFCENVLFTIKYLITKVEYNIRDSPQINLFLWIILSKLP
ncbi:hypothetical protein Bhyg_02005 [Pseudolycoriella hygida]|uniref:Uncharacterized protein n=1 Tax=Pseudolycoriella hygida TaxID=35572 RepID=A0A9Q0NBV3_9DIPT|nr:hypothetical protein Bhyg_02005 [Pseudolycoriella hygida]